VSLVVLGKDTVGSKCASAVERALGDDALPFAEQIGQEPLISYRYAARPVGDFEAYPEIIAALDAPFLDEAADAHALARLDVLVEEIGGRIEEDNRVLERNEDEPGRERQNGKRATDQRQTSLSAGHCTSSIRSI